MIMYVFISKCDRPPANGLLDNSIFMCAAAHSEVSEVRRIFDAVRDWHQFSGLQLGLGFCNGLEIVPFLYRSASALIHLSSLFHAPTEAVLHHMDHVPLSCLGDIFGHTFEHCKEEVTTELAEPGS